MDRLGQRHRRSHGRNCRRRSELAPSETTRAHRTRDRQWTDLPDVRMGDADLPICQASSKTDREQAARLETCGRLAGAERFDACQRTSASPTARAKEHHHQALRDRQPALAQTLAEEQTARMLRCASAAVRGHHPYAYQRAADARERGHRALSRREGISRPPRLRRPDRQDPRPAHPRERGLGALQARPWHRSPANRRGAGHKPRAVGHHRAARV